MRLINADALIDTLYDHEFASYIDKGEVSTVINDEPTVDAEPVKHGKWKKIRGAINCSACKSSSWSMSFEGLVTAFNYCPNCGARMEKPE